MFCSHGHLWNRVLEFCCFPTCLDLVLHLFRQFYGIMNLNLSVSAPFFACSPAQIIFFVLGPGVFVAQTAEPRFKADPDGDVVPSQQSVRTFFPESWIWQMQQAE